MTKTGSVLFNHVSKRYRLGLSGTLRDAIAGVRARDDGKDDGGRVLWALRDVSFRVERGEALGLIGPNGAGKTTILKLLSKITKPSSGQIEVHGRASSLIELGAGFHPELTGRDNIYLNGAILGLTRRDITHKLDEIIAFSDLERFIDTPVKRYSSGMYVRLGFAVAAHVEPDILLVDEVLAVGDSAFRTKCLDRMDEMRKSGTTMILVSHNMYQVQRLCERTLLLVNGKGSFIGDTREAISIYEENISSIATDPEGSARMGYEHRQLAVMISMVALSDPAGQPVERMNYDESLVVRADYRAMRPVVNPIVRVRLVRSDGTVCAMTSSRYFPDAHWTLVGTGCFVVQLDPIQLITGTYSVEIRVLDAGDTVVLGAIRSDSVYVHSPGLAHEQDRGFFVPRAHWSHESLLSPTETSGG